MLLLDVVFMALQGKEIMRVYDALGPIQVFDDGNRRHLAFGTDDEQGCILKQNPAQVQYGYIKAMLLVLLFESDPKACLLLGLGSGALLQSLFESLPDCQITAVELRRQVIQLAYSHLYLPRDPRVTVVEADAGSYLLNAQPQQYPLIFSDIYSSGGMDPQQTQTDFILRCKRALAPQGWLVINFWEEHRNVPFLDQLRAQFSNLWVNRIDSGNWIVFASNGTQRPIKKQTKPQIKALSQRLGFSVSKVFQGLESI